MWYACGGEGRVGERGVEYKGLGIDAYRYFTGLQTGPMGDHSV